MDENIIERIAVDFGYALLLYSKSTLHSSWSVGMASGYVLPALLHKQYVIVKDDYGNPIAYASWAKFDLEREVRYLENPHSILVEDWNCGDRLWFIDWVSPLGNKVSNELYNHFRCNLFPYEVARSLRVKSGEKNARIKSYGGAGLSIHERRLLLHKCYLELKEFFNGKNSKISF